MGLTDQLARARGRIKLGWHPTVLLLLLATPTSYCHSRINPGIKMVSLVGESATRVHGLSYVTATAKVD